MAGIQLKGGQRTMHRAKPVGVVLTVLVVAIAIASVALFTRNAGADGAGQIRHVLLISVDGMHQSDLDWYVAQHPNSEFAKLAGGGAEYSNVKTSDPSDSDPGGTALMTGADPRASGVYYDVEYNHRTYEAGTTCTGPTGGDVVYDSPDDLDDTQLDAGQGIPGLAGDPSLILRMTGNPQTVLNPSTFPVDPKTCTPIWPHSYLKVNTIFEVVKAAGMRTAWSDKHPVYESFNGPSGNGIDDLFTPEIDSTAIEPNGTPYPGDIGWTGDNAATRQYDGYKVQAIVNEIDGYAHSGTGPRVGAPAIFGMNFQTVSTAEKLFSSEATIGGPVLAGGYLPGTTTPGPLLSSALDYVNLQLKRMVGEIQAEGLASSTAIIVTAKHGQSPQDPNQLTRIKDGPIIDAINAAWTAAHPGAGNLIVAGTDDDLWQSYLSDTSQAAADFVRNYLWNHDATGVTYDGGTRTLQHSGLAQIYAGRAAADFFGVPTSDPRHPDVLGRVQVGVVYTGGRKIAEHGGDNPADRDVLLVVYAPGTVPPARVHASVETTQVAPTILRLLSLDPDALQAVRSEGTRVLPGIH
jgi:type I phosphodiesterase/nucleotide pyrophosphatase